MTTMTCLSPNACHMKSTPVRASHAAHSAPPPFRQFALSHPRRLLRPVSPRRPLDPLRAASSPCHTLSALSCVPSVGLSASPPPRRPPRPSTSSFSLSAPRPLRAAPSPRGALSAPPPSALSAVTSIAMIAVSLPGYSVAKLLKYSRVGEQQITRPATPIYRDYEAPPCEAMCQAVPVRDHFICVYDHCSKKLYFFTVSTGELSTVPIQFTMDGDFVEFIA